LSALNVIFSVRRKKGEIPEKAIRNGILMRGFVIIIIGVLFNPMSLQTAGEVVPFPANLWGWNILMFIGFSQIFSYYVLKFKKITRAIIGVLIIYFSPWIRELLYEGKVAGNLVFVILHFIITSPLPQVPILPYLSVCFISTIFGEFLYEAMVKGTKESYYRLFRIFAFYGIVLVLVGLFIIVPRGLNLDIWEIGLSRLKPAVGVPFPHSSPGYIIESEYLHIHLLEIANQQPFTPFDAMPIFMIRCSAQNMFYNLGVGFLVIAVTFYFVDIKKKSNDVIKLLIFYGKISLSLFLIQYLFLPLYLGQFPITIFPLIWVGYCGFLGLLMYIWLNYFNGVGTPEWIMGKIGSIGQKKRHS
ncbi:MAG: heparan-alpha-glucosaminide N-acetyltransferase domain-containing protein, partial [Candidatus Odinarchaeota archaeon]